MSSLLYRLGRFAARRAWAMVALWALILAGAGTAAATLSKPFTSEMTIPGTEFQKVLNELAESLPEAAHGTSPIVLRTADGSQFTAAQKQTVSQVLEQWADIPGVDKAVDPFATQAELDDAAAQVRDGEKELTQAKKTIAENTTKLADGKKKVADGQAEITKNSATIENGRTQLGAAEAQLAKGERSYRAGVNRLAKARADLRAGQRQIDDGRARITKAKRDVAAGKRQLAPQREQLAAARRQLNAAKAQLTQGRARLAQEEARVDALAEQVGEDDPRVVAARKELATQKARLDATAKTIAGQESQLVAGEKQVNAASAKLRAADQEIATQERTLEAGERKLRAGRAQLRAGENELAAAKRKLDSGRAAIAANRAKLNNGAAQLAKGRSDLAAAVAEIRSGETQLADARTKLPDAEAKLARGKRQVALIQGLRVVNEANNTAVTEVSFDVAMPSVEPATKEELQAATGALSAAGLTVDFSQDIVQELSVLGPGEVIGLVVAGIVLMVMLGSLLAAGLPLLMALVGVGTGLAGAVALTKWWEMNTVTPTLALMLGLAVGIDYCLFLVHRHREQLAQGVELHDSIARANGTAGGAVLFAGMTVVVALAALVLTGIPFLGVMGLVAAATVAISVAVALTLTPALLSLMGQRVLSSKGRARLAEKLRADEAEAADDDEHAGRAAVGGHGWGGLVTRHPWLTMIATTALLALLAVPALSLRLGLPDGSYEPHDSTAYRTYSTISQEFGPGRNGPVIAVARLDQAKAKTMSDDQLTDLGITLAESLKKVNDVAYVVPGNASADRTLMVLQLVPESGPSDVATENLVHDLRAAAPTLADHDAVTSMGFTGQTLANIDISQALAEALPGYLAVVVGISLVLLLLVFRSLVVPVLATAGFLLSVAAAFGAVVAVYQWGWGGTLFGVEQPGLVLSFLPTLVIGILFGLAMDYQMFMVAGMRESYMHGHAARSAVRAGFSHGARVVTAAALIMTAVFASFIHAELVMIRPIGFALAVGVLIDAFVVRMTAMPAIMHILGDKAWYLPKWLDRVLPDLDVEGTRLVSSPAVPAAAAVGAGGAGRVGGVGGADGVGGVGASGGSGVVSTRR